MAILTASTPYPGPIRSATRKFADWWPIWIGLLALYLPVIYDLFETIWQTEEQAHGPIILVVLAYLVWRKRTALDNASPPRLVAGGAFLCLGLLFYAEGRAQNIYILELGSVPLIGAGVTLMKFGTQGLRTLAFPLFFSMFMIPLPGILVDAATGPLKLYISKLSTDFLYLLGYPIGRSGVAIVIGPYHLLVADACSGLHSMFSLSALGILFLYLVHYRNPVRNVLILASILPIAFAANVVRVIVLILVTYQFGDSAGQGFVHGFAGVLLFCVSLILLFSVNSLLGRFKGLRDAVPSTTLLK
jgi:exosortase B